MTDRLGTMIRGCTAAHRRLEGTLRALDDAALRLPSELPGWTVGHVLTHLARNAESHLRILDAALEGRAVEQYPGGHEQRSADIEAGSSRSAVAIREDVTATASALEAAWGRMTAEAWQEHGLAQGEPWPCRALPFHRWREVELHHADLGLGYVPGDWPDDYVDLELPLALRALPERLAGEDARRVLAWLVGRAGQPAGLDLASWQAHYHLLPAGLVGGDGMA